MYKRPPISPQPNHALLRETRQQFAEQSSHLGEDTRRMIFHDGPHIPEITNPETLPETLDEATGDHISNFRSVILVAFLTLATANLGGCALFTRSTKPDNGAKPATAAHGKALQAFEEGRFVEALELYTHVDIKKLSDDDYQNIEDIQDGIDEKVTSFLRTAKSAEAADEDHMNNYPEALENYKLALSKMERIHPYYKKTKFDMNRLAKKIQQLKKEFFTITEDKIDDLFESGNYINLAYEIRRMFEISAALNYDETLSKDGTPNEICLGFAKKYFGNKQYKSALLFFLMAQGHLLPGESIPQEYKDMHAAAEYWNRKKWTEKRKKIAELGKKLKATSDKAKREALSAEIQKLQSSDLTQVTKKSGKGDKDSADSVVGQLVIETENLFPDKSELKKSKKKRRRRRWRKKPKPEPENPPELAKIKPVIDIGPALEVVNSLIDNNNDVETVKAINLFAEKYKKELVRQRGKISPTLSKLLKKANQAYIKQNPKKALEYYRLVLLLNPNHKYAVDQINRMEHVLK